MSETVKIILIILSILVGLYLIINLVLSLILLPMINKPKRRTRDWQKEYFASISNAYKNNKLTRNPIQFIMKDGSGGDKTALVQHGAFTDIAFSKNAIRLNIPSGSTWELGSAQQTFIVEYTKSTT